MSEQGCFIYRSRPRRPRDLLYAAQGRGGQGKYDEYMMKCMMYMIMHMMMYMIMYNVFVYAAQGRGGQGFFLCRSRPRRPRNDNDVYDEVYMII